MRNKIFRAMQDYDNWVVEFEYCDSRGNVSRRIVSPIRYLSSNRFLGLCLSREEPRQFCLSRCRKLELRRACDYVMPVPLAS